ncbi:MAG: tRNA (N(6)-L-threonylcarbamoyladenosine(37)-C(2))-methylthiotransferase MtaB [Desulfamplus sp.]|nr:tRNA (N(6)-L-threonylcarbamoyladenosine(37)-C(2))-methylthiotransferase MtaB [Desulfamplus sp.]
MKKSTESEPSEDNNLPITDQITDQNRAKTFYISTLGCKVNQYESDGIASELIDNGWHQVKRAKDASICIINSCAVTARAAMQSRQQIRSTIRAKLEDAKVFVTGCHAETATEEIRKIEGVDIVAGHNDKFKIAKMILNLNLALNSDSEQNFSSFFYSFKPAVTGSKTRAYLKIQDGCNSFCTYCIVPYARGRSRSMPKSEVIEHLLNLSSKGYKEAILTGIHVGAYGLDFACKSSLTELMVEIDSLKPIHRIRLSSIEPKELTDKIIDLAAKRAILCDHFHIPLQSGDDLILKRMGRPYNSEMFSNLITKIHNKIPTVAIGVDILVGFPGESDLAFENTFNLIKELPISYLHVFPFSPRKGTPAYDYPNKVNNQIVTKRCEILRQLGATKRLEFEDNIIKQSKELALTFESVIQDKRDSKTGKIIAVTSNYLTVLVDGSDELKRQILEIKLEGRDEKSNKIVGKIAYYMGAIS